MSTVIVLAQLLYAATLTAQPPVPPQPPAPPQASVPQAAERQPVVRHGLAAAGEPVAPAKGWALRPGDPLDADVPGVVSTHGPGVRITPETDLTVFRPRWSLAGEFRVSALFQAQASSGPYGLTVGGERGMAFLVRPDGTFAVQPLGGAKPTGGTWSPAALRHAADGAPAANRLEVRVGLTEAAFLVNGVVVRVIPIAGGQLDGAPGVHVAAQGDVAVAGFTVQGAAALLTPSAGK